MQYNNLGKSIAIYSTSSYPSAFRLLSARPHVNMETDSPNRLKNTIKPCIKYCSLAFLSPYLVWIWGRYSHRELYNTLFSFLGSLHCHTALTSLHLCRPEGPVFLTTVLLSLQQHSGAAVSSQQYEPLCHSGLLAGTTITGGAHQSRTRELEASSKAAVRNRPQELLPEKTSTSSGALH